MKKDELRHYGILGMRWGKRRGAGSVTSVNVGRGSIGRAKEVAGLAVDGARHDIQRLKSAASKLSNNKAFKTLVYDKDDVTGLIFKKSEVEKLKNFLSKKGTALREGFHKWEVKSQDRDIKLFREIASKLKKSHNLAEVKLAKEHEDAANYLEKDLNDLFTPEELKRYRGG